MNVIQKALIDAESAWEEMKNTPIHMGVEEFEKKVIRRAKRYGVEYSLAKGMWLHVAKKELSDPGFPQEMKNLYLCEAHPPELKKAERKFDRALTTLMGLAEWSYQSLKTFLDDESKDLILRTFLRWRIFLPAEAYYKFSLLNLHGNKSRQNYLSLNPTVVFRSK